jgi:L-rhamnose mutarotase
MERVLWKGRLVPGQEQAYRKIHDEIWPEMTQNLNNQGIRNYSIFIRDLDVIGYYECPSIDHMKKVKAESEVAARWAKAMEGIIEIETVSPTSGSVFEQVFYHAGEDTPTLDVAKI